MYLNGEKPKNLRECLERLKKSSQQLTSDEYGFDRDNGIFNPPASEKEIKEYEESFGITFPDDYREFLKFSNGATVMGVEIYGLDSVGMDDDYVPDGYLALTYNETTNTRLAISETDGKMYMVMDHEPNPHRFESFLMHQLEICEEEIIAVQKKKEQAVKSPETLKKEKEKYDDLIARMKKAIEADRK